MIFHNASLQLMLKWFDYLKKYLNYWVLDLIIYHIVIYIFCFIYQNQIDQESFGIDSIGSVLRVIAI